MLPTRTLSACKRTDEIAVLMRQWPCCRLEVDLDHRCITYTIEAEEALQFSSESKLWPFKPKGVAAQPGIGEYGMMDGGS